MPSRLARFAVSVAAALSMLVFVAGVFAQSDKPQSAADAADADARAQKPKKDAYAGKTVKTTQDGYGLIRARGRHAPKVGAVAPDFKLKTADGKKTVKLSSFRGKKPVVLVFGSFT